MMAVGLTSFWACFVYLLSVRLFLINEDQNWVNCASVFFSSPYFKIWRDLEYFKIS